MSGPKCATAAPTSVSYDDYRAAQEAAARQELARHVREKRALSAAKSRVGALQQDHSALRKRVDEARNRLPDLAYVLDDLPAFPDPDHVAAWQSYAVTLEAQIHAWRASAEKAIAHGDYLQRRRERTREAWAQHQALRDELVQQRNDLRELVEALGEPLPEAVDSSVFPATEAECEEVERGNEALRHVVERLRERIARCKDTVQANEALRGALDRLVRRQALASSAVALSEWRTSEQATRLQQFEDRLRQHLHELELSESGLPGSLRTLLADIRLGHHSAEGIDFWARIAGFVEQRHQRAQAIELLSTPPFMEDADLIERWQGLCRELDQVANGLSELTPTLRRACDDLHGTAKERMGLRYTRLAVRMALRESGFVAVERDDIQFNDSQGDHVLLGLPSYQDHCVLMRVEGGQLHWIPFRTNDAADSGAQVRDREFDNAACSKLHRAADGMNSARSAAIGEFAGLADSDEHPVLLASEMAELGVHIEQQATKQREPRQAFRDTGGT